MKRFITRNCSLYISSQLSPSLHHLRIHPGSLPTIVSLNSRSAVAIRGSKSYSDVTPQKLEERRTTVKMQEANRLKKALGTGNGVSMGVWQMIPGSNVSRLMARSGVDWVLIDQEHGNIDGKISLYKFLSMGLENTSSLDLGHLLFGSLEGGGYHFLGWPGVDAPVSSTCISFSQFLANSQANKRLNRCGDA
jgi:hypothetical protein